MTARKSGWRIYYSKHYISSMHWASYFQPTVTQASSILPANVQPCRCNITFTVFIYKVRNSGVIVAYHFLTNELKVIREIYRDFCVFTLHLTRRTTIFGAMLFEIFNVFLYNKYSTQFTFHKFLFLLRTLYIKWNQIKIQTTVIRTRSWLLAPWPKN